MKRANKYFTLSFDDGVTQDRRIIDILKKYGAMCATFNINTGLYGANWDWVGKHFNRPDVTHIRFTEDELMGGIYDGFELASHTLHHPSLKNYDSCPSMIECEIARDAENIERICHVKPVGMAWPGGDSEYTDTTISCVVDRTCIRYARCTTRTGDFARPEYFMKWYPTCSLSDDDCLSLARRFISEDACEDRIFYVWCHGYEFDIYDTWDRLEELVRMMTSDGNIILATNGEIYNRFKNEIPSWK